jgi:hypothetical protein
MTKPHELHLPPHDDMVTLWSGDHYTVALHQDGFILAVYLAWSLIGLAVYLFGHGLAPRPRTLLGLFCGPGAWIAAGYKCYHLEKHRRDALPPPLPKVKPPPLRHWEFKPRN